MPEFEGNLPVTSHDGPTNGLFEHVELLRRDAH
jgi:hypothetical protein